MKLGKSIIVMMTAVAAMVGNAGESAEFRLDTKDGPRIARAVETIAYSTEWSDGSTVSVAVDGVVIKDATAPASGDVIWNAAQAGAGRHTLTHTSGGVTMTAVFEADLCYALRFAANASDATGTMLDMSVAYGDSASLPVCAFEREGYFFVGWSTSSNVNAAVHFDTETMKFNYDSMGVYRPGDVWKFG